MRKTTVILAALILAAGSISACSQAETTNWSLADTTQISSPATPSQALPSRTNTKDSPSEVSATDSAEKPTVSAFQEPSGVNPTEAEKTGVGQTSGKQSGVSQSAVSSPKNEDGKVNGSGNSNGSAPKQSGSPTQKTEPEPVEKPQSDPAPKATEAPKQQPKPTEAPAPEPPEERFEIDYGQVVGNLIAYGQQLGMVYNGSLGLGGSGWFPPTDVSGYSDTASATVACYGDVDYVAYYYAGLGAEPCDIMFNVIASGSQIYVVYA